ncbi:MAG TPA: phenylalanine--tRNA ligase subunit beta [Candidatus Enterousia intestinigallinarum]|uniref:Phenylalanine--tRNA ligase beta subunit n=1 Tax=Candidatus Enterousia intestinigallinarum TaxID=2840790 RepID=A0A9D1JWV3_9PROT|nr:phenylalanine--tRNA ligase subunit beta [Candidatus Enterousia intestinigallinarum]
MKWTYDWLKDYLKTDLSAEQIADMLTRTGLEVEDLITPIAPIAARIVECEPMTGSDHLHILKVDDGTDTLRQVVCGAPNARVGLVSALALPGCVIEGHEIKAGKLRGVMSNGMMCSARELGIGDDHSGIIELPDDTKIGAPVVQMETVFDAGITPNRPDYLAVRGIARDLAACGAGQYIAPNDDVLNPVKSARKVNIKTDKCPVYQFCEIHNINISPSNNTIKSRLAAIGINPKNAPIDATNYICYDMGQPMHCFDADEINGDITVRMANAGEQFTDLFGNTHELRETDMVIADDTGILALAGVVGGARGMTTDKTKNIILESAYFDPVCVRKTSKRLGISTDSSYRYERGIDPTITGVALARAAHIIMGVCGGEIVGTGIGGKIPAENRHIEYSPELFARKTGVEMPVETQRDILKNLGFDVVEKSGIWTVTPRAARVDVMIPENIVSELIRIYGYDNIIKNAAHRPADLAPHRDYYIGVKRELATRGLNEAKSFGFGNSKTETLLSDKPIVRVANPIVANMDTARNGLLGNMLHFVAENEKRGYPDLSMFELGTVFDGDTPDAQHTQICIIRAGDTAPRHWTRRNRPADIYDVKADLISLLHGQRFTVSSDNPPHWAHPFRYGAIMQGKKKIAEFGELHPSIARALKIKTNVNIAIVDDVENLPASRHGREPKLSEFQPITRDFAFIVDGTMPAEKLTGVAMATDARIVDTVVFDAFDLPDGKKSIAFTITIIPTDNMTDEDLQKLQNAVIANVEKRCDAKIRDK